MSREQAKLAIGIAQALSGCSLFPSPRPYKPRSEWKPGDEVKDADDEAMARAHEKRLRKAAKRLRAQ